MGKSQVGGGGRCGGGSAARQSSPSEGPWTALKPVDLSEGGGETKEFENIFPTYYIKRHEGTECPLLGDAASRGGEVHFEPTVQKCLRTGLADMASCLCYVFVTLA